MKTGLLDPARRMLWMIRPGKALNVGKSVDTGKTVKKPVSGWTAFVEREVVNDGGLDRLALEYGVGRGEPRPGPGEMPPPPGRAQSLRPRPDQGVGLGKPPEDLPLKQPAAIQVDPDTVDGLAKPDGGGYPLGIGGVGVPLGGLEGYQEGPKE